MTLYTCFRQLFEIIELFVEVAQTYMLTLFPVHRLFIAISASLSETGFDGATEYQNRFAVVLFRFVDARWTRPECVVCRQHLDGHCFVFDQISCDFRQESVNMNVFDFAHECVSVQRGVWTATMVHSARASIAFHQ